MKREIKFRAWNEKHSNPKERMMENATVVNSRVIMPDGDDWGIPIMQFTGLLDKNGKEIYEGDVCRTVGEDGHGIKGVIIYKEIKGAFLLKFNLGKDDFLRLGNINLEVIGNIYENPDLLK